MDFICLILTLYKNLGTVLYYTHLTLAAVMPEHILLIYSALDMHRYMANATTSSHISHDDVQSLEYALISLQKHVFSYCAICPMLVVY